MNDIKMKKTLILLATLSAIANAAKADESSVTLYGVIDLALGTINGQANTDANLASTVNPTSANKSQSSVTGMFNGGIQASRWGLTGKEDLGGGTKAIFTLESGFSANSGTLNNNAAALNDGNNNATGGSFDGQLFGRQAWVGLTNKDYGTLTLGRTYTLLYDTTVTYDPVQYAQLFTPLGSSSKYGGGAGVSEYTRLDNSLKYVNKIGHVSVGAQYKFGNIAGNTQEGSAYGLSLGYENGAFALQTAYFNATDSIATSAGNALTNSAISSYTPGSSSTLNGVAYNNSGYIVAAKYKVNGDASFKGGYEHYTLSAASDTITQSTVSSFSGYSFNALTSYNGTDQNVNIYYAGGDYNLTPNFNVSAGYYLVSFEGYKSNTVSKAGSSVSGVNNTYTSLLADYRLSKRTDVYAGLMFGHFGGTDTSGSINYQDNSRISIVATGLRTIF